LETVQGRHGKPTISNNASLYRRRRFPAEVIAHGVWLYLRFPLGPRVLALRGIDITYQTIPHWAEKFGRQFAVDIRRRARSFRKFSVWTRRVWEDEMVHPASFAVS
jgi:transposase-like protein